MKKNILISTISLLIVSFFTTCVKKNIDPENNFSYKIGLRKYNYEYSTSPKLFGGYYRSIDAEQISGGFTMYANYTSKSHNTIDISFINSINDLPQSNNTVGNGDLFVTLENYKGPKGDFYILDYRYSNGYIKFNHISEEYVEGSFDLKLVKTDRNDYTKISPDKTIHLKSGKFRIQIH